MKKNTKKQIKTLKDKNIHIRLNMQDYEMLKSLKDKYNLTMYDVIKIGLYSQSYNQTQEQIRLLSNATNNLNQISKHCNQTNTAPIKNDIDNVLNRINDYIDKMELLFLGYVYDNEDIKEE